MTNFGSWYPTHRVPVEGLATRSLADPATPGPPLPGGLDVVVLDWNLSGWDRVVCSNGFSCWVPTGRLAPIPIPWLAPPPDWVDPFEAEPQRSGRGRRLATWIGAAVVVLLAVGVVASMVGRDGDGSAAVDTVEAVGAEGDTAGATEAQGADPGDGLSREEFVAQANAVCAAASVEFERIQAEVLAGLGADPDLTEAAGALARILEGWEPILEHRNQQLRDLDGPEPDRSALDEILGDLEAEFIQFRDLVSTAAGGDAEALQRVSSESDSAFADPNRRAGELGLDECAG